MFCTESKMKRILQKFKKDGILTHVGSDRKGA